MFSPVDAHVDFGGGRYLNIRIHHVRAVAGLGRSRLALQAVVESSPPAAFAEHRVVIHGDVWFAEGLNRRGLFGLVDQRGRVCVLPGADQHVRRDVELAIDFHADDLVRIEDLRGEYDFAIRLDLRVRVEAAAGGDTVAFGSGYIQQLRIGPADWAELLVAWGYADRAVVTVPLAAIATHRTGAPRSHHSGGRRRWSSRGGTARPSRHAVMQVSPC